MLISRRYTIIIAWAILFLLASKSQAQDLHFSQFYNAPLYLNPALTGKINSKFRLAANYRSQYSRVSNPTPYSTIAASADMGLFRDRLNNDIFGVGLMFMSDNQVGGLIRTQHIMLSTAYHKGLGRNKDHYLSAGFQFDMYHRSLNLFGLDFEDEFEGTGFTGITGEVFENSSIWVPNMNVGLFWSSRFGNKITTYGGVSLGNVLTPKESFLLSDNADRKMKTTANAGMTIDLAKKVLLSPNAMYITQGPSSMLLAGSSAGINLSGRIRPYETILYFGAWYNVNGAIIGSTGVQYKGLQVGLSYDSNVGEIKNAARNFGAFELSIIFVDKPVSKKDRYQIIHCPKF